MRGVPKAKGRKHKCECGICDTCKHRIYMRRYKQKLKERPPIPRYEWDRTVPGEKW